MLDMILILIIIASMIFSFLTVKFWKKNNFIKEVYVGEATSITLYILTIAVTGFLLVLYLIESEKPPHSWLFLLIILCFDVMLLLIFCFDATTCIYLENDTLYQKSIFQTKQILLTEKISIIEKVDKKIIKSDESSISINSRYLTGNINDLMFRIKAIVNH